MEMNLESLKVQIVFLKLGLLVIIVIAQAIIPRHTTLLTSVRRKSRKRGHSKWSQRFQILSRFIWK